MTVELSSQVYSSRKSHRCLFRPIYVFVDQATSRKHSNLLLLSGRVFYSVRFHGGLSLKRKSQYKVLEPIPDEIRLKFPRTHNNSASIALLDIRNFRLIRRDVIQLAIVTN